MFTLVVNTNKACFFKLLYLYCLKCYSMNMNLFDLIYRVFNRDFCLWYISCHLEKWDWKPLSKYGFRNSMVFEFVFLKIHFSNLQKPNLTAFSFWKVSARVCSWPTQDWVGCFSVNGPSIHTHRPTQLLGQMLLMNSPN